MLGGLRDSSPQSSKNRRMKHMITESNASRYFFNELISISHDVINSQIPLTNSLTLQTGLLEDLDSVPNSAITLLSQSKRSYRCPDVPFTCDRLQTMSILSFKPHNNLDLEFKRLAQDHTVKSWEAEQMLGLRSSDNRTLLMAPWLFREGMVIERHACLLYILLCLTQKT